MALGPGGQIALQGGVDIASGVVGNLFQKRNIRLQKDANLELANYAYDKDLEQWHLQNQYNTPQAQMTRFKQAGLNPNLIYGQGNAGNASASPKMTPVTQALHTTKMPKLNILGLYNNQRQVEAGLQKTEADTNRTEELTTTQESISIIKAIDAELKNAMLAFWQGGGQPVSRQYTIGGKTRTMNPYNYKYNNLRAKHNLSIDHQLYVNNLNIKKQALLDANIQNAWQNLKMNQRKYLWYPYQQGFGMVNQAAKTALGAVGIGKAGRLLGGKQSPTKLKKPDTTFASWMKKGQTVNQNYTRKRYPTINQQYY